jgi:hypothetical protein
MRIYVCLCTILLTVAVLHPDAAYSTSPSYHIKSTHQYHGGTISALQDNTVILNGRQYTFDPKLTVFIRRKVANGSIVEKRGSKSDLYIGAFVYLKVEPGSRVTEIIVEGL